MIKGDLGDKASPVYPEVPYSLWFLYADAGKIETPLLSIYLFIHQTRMALTVPIKRSQERRAPNSSPDHSH